MYMSMYFVFIWCKLLHSLPQLTRDACIRGIHVVSVHSLLHVSIDECTCTCMHCTCDIMGMVHWSMGV